jgi:diguanylate cyclase (GGDEF)-like protein
MNIADILNIIEEFTEIFVFKVDESGSIKSRIFNSKEKFSPIGVTSIYDFFSKEDSRRVSEMLSVGVDDDRDHFKLKSTFGISDEVSIGIRVINNETYICFKFIKSERERNIQYEKRMSELEMAASRDSMTELLNKYGYWERVKNILYSGDPERKLGILLLDVDNLKGINDTMGHKGGDKALKQISRLISTTIRSRDIAVRFGGDEFLIVVEELTGIKSTAHGLGKRLVRAINENRSQFMTTLSIGVHVVKVGDFEKYLLNEKVLKEKWDKAVDIADKMAYKAKESGRNRVVYSGEI